MTFCALSSEMTGRVEIEVEYENIGVIPKLKKKLLNLKLELFFWALINIPIDF